MNAENVKLVFLSGTPIINKPCEIAVLYNMLKGKTYSCGICKTTPDQISHHKSHIKTQKHKDKKEIFLVMPS